MPAECSLIGVIEHELSFLIFSVVFSRKGFFVFKTTLECVRVKVLLKKLLSEEEYEADVKEWRGIHSGLDAKSLHASP